MIRPSPPKFGKTYYGQIYFLVSIYEDFQYRNLAIEIVTTNIHSKTQCLEWISAPTGAVIILDEAEIHSFWSLNLSSSHLREHSGIRHMLMPLIHIGTYRDI